MIDEWRSEHWVRMDCWAVDEGLPSPSLLSSLFDCSLFLSSLLAVSEMGFLDQFQVDEYRKDLVMAELLLLLLLLSLSLGQAVDDSEKCEDIAAQHDDVERFKGSATTVDDTPRDDICDA